MDCWVAQLGVVTETHKNIAVSNTLRTDARGRVALAASTVLRNREISPFVFDMGNNGQLSNSGIFRTSEGDIQALVEVHLAEARARWNLGNKPIDVCIYAHGGLVGAIELDPELRQAYHALHQAHGRDQGAAARAAQERLEQQYQQRFGQPMPR